MYPLYVVKKNAYGNPQLTEMKTKNTEKVNFYDLKKNEYWSIKDPSDNVRYLLQTYFSNHSIYECKGVIFAISPEAAKFFKSENTGHGSGIVIEFVDLLNNHWYLLISDDKHYISNVQGTAECNETFEECLKREVKEETQIDISDIVPVPIASYTFTYRNALVDCEYEVVSQIYYVLLQWDRVTHLFKKELISGEINIINADELDLKDKLDEVNYIITIPVSMNMEDVPEKFDTIQVNKTIKGEIKQVSADYSKISHHRQFIDLFDNEIPIVKPPFLSSITFNKRRKDAIKEFIEINTQNTNLCTNDK